jgi:peptidoglycan/xylan/chitin deacetylase (PgdA/CDA1 family)
VPAQIALKIDVDTYRGIADGATRLASFLSSQKIPASFFVTMGPDTSGWAATRVFRHRGFFQKMRRTSALSLYGFRTAFSGTLLPARPMGTSFAPLLRQWRDQGFEVSPHGFDHIRWHDEAAGWSEERAAGELEKIVEIYRHIFGEDPKSFAAPGWQAGPGPWRAMEKMNLLYHSDTRGETPYFPSPQPSPSTGRGGTASLLPVEGEGGRRPDEGFKTLEIPTTLPTWDEMLSWDGMTRHNLAEETWKLLKPDRLNVWTIHAEVEGTVYFPQFHEFVERAAREAATWVFLPDAARRLLGNSQALAHADIEQGTLPGRAGTVTCQITGIKDKMGATL